MSEKQHWGVIGFLVLAVVTAGLDLWTKDWASGQLARFEHPLALRVESGDEGKTLSEFLATSRFPGTSTENLLKLSAPLSVKAEDTVRPYDLWQSGQVGWYLFLDQKRDESPLFILNPVQQARREGETSGDREGWRKEWSSRSMTWAELLLAEHPFLGEARIRELLEAQLCHPVLPARGLLDGSRKVTEGESYLVLDRTIDLIPGFLRFVYAENPGAAWGVLANASLVVRQVVLQGFSIVAMLFVLGVAWRVRRRGQVLPVMLGLGMILGGALGNLVERFGQHYVVDFIDMYVGSSHWPTYNVADIGISVGVGLLALQMLRKRPPFDEPPKSRN